MSTQLLFRDDAYLNETEASVLAVREDGGIVLDRTVFYATGGGQPGDRGSLILADGSEIAIDTASWNGADKTEIVHLPRPGQPSPRPGERVTARIDWPTRYARMRVHSALHLLSVVLPYPVTGGSIGEGEGRLDFDIPEAGLDKDSVSARLAELIGRDAELHQKWISDEELDANPGLVKTMSVQPPRGAGRVRLIEIAGLDLQPCGGTHVRRTGEIGKVTVTQIEKKGKQNRRVRIALG
jgi:misacylated tRNA(Ala) deacylase